MSKDVGEVVKPYRRDTSSQKKGTTTTSYQGKGKSRRAAKHKVPSKGNLEDFEGKQVTRSPKGSSLGFEERRNRRVDRRAPGGMYKVEHPWHPGETPEERKLRHREWAINHKYENWDYMRRLGKRAFT
jgi:hypothetical protein